MADITMCTAKNDDGECPVKESCYRFMAEGHPLWQSMMAMPSSAGKNKIMDGDFYCQDRIPMD